MLQKCNSINFATLNDDLVLVSYDYYNSTIITAIRSFILTAYEQVCPARLQLCRPVSSLSCALGLWQITPRWHTDKFFLMYIFEKWTNILRAKEK